MTPLKSSEGPARTRDTSAVEKDGYAYMLLCKRNHYDESPRASRKHTSYLALRTEKGFSKNPTPTRVVAPAMRLPVEERRGNVDECSEDEGVRTAAKYGEFIIAKRTRESPVMYIAIPGTFRIRLAVDPRHKPKKPSEATISLVTRIREARLGVLFCCEHVVGFPWARSTLNEKHRLSEAVS